MAATVYCKKCGRDMPMTEVCPRCGAKLGRNASRVAWCAEHSPVRDWMTWNSAMRIILPAGVLVLALILVPEAVFGGWPAVENLLRHGLVYSVLGLVFVCAAALLLVFALQGDDLLDCSIDSKGIHVQQYLPNPTPMKLLLRFRSPRLMAQVNPADEVPMVLTGQKDLAWKDVARVQLWPEKTLILFYSPAWWVRVWTPCTPFTYPDALAYISDRIGAKKNVLLPPELAVTKTKATAAPRSSRAPARDPAPLPDMSDYADMLAEIKAMNDEDAARPE